MKAKQNKDVKAEVKVKIKADDKVEFEEGTKEKFTHFELLQKEVEVLKETLDGIVDILNYNGINKIETIEPEGFDYDEVFNRLEND